MKTMDLSERLARWEQVRARGKARFLLTSIWKWLLVCIAGSLIIGLIANGPASLTQTSSLVILGIVACVFGLFSGLSFGSMLWGMNERFYLEASSAHRDAVTQEQKAAAEKQLVQSSNARYVPVLGLLLAAPGLRGLTKSQSPLELALAIAVVVLGVGWFIGAKIYFRRRARIA